MTTQRANLYKAIHKAVRVGLSQLVSEAGRTDFTDAGSLSRLRASVAAAFDRCEDHASREDEFVMPLLRTCAPDIAARLDATHLELEASGATLSRALALVAVAGPRAADDGHAFVLQLSRYQAAQLSHMADEEEFAMPALWRACGDETLRAVHERIIASLPPQALAGDLMRMLPAVNAPERAELMSAVQAKAPAPAFEGLMRLAAQALDQEALARLERDLSPARAA